MAELRCDHKFVDSTRCLKCGWKPWEPNPNRAPQMPPMIPTEDRAPRFALTEDTIATLRERYREDTLTGSTATAAHVRMLLAELDAQRRAHATAYAEGLEAAIRVVRERSLWTVTTHESLYGYGTDRDACLTSDIVPRLEALRDAAPPACGAD
jgi:hypothetical protein